MGQFKIGYVLIIKKPNLYLNESARELVRARWDFREESSLFINEPSLSYAKLGLCSARLGSLPALITGYEENTGGEESWGEGGELQQAGCF